MEQSHYSTCIEACNHCADACDMCVEECAKHPMQHWQECAAA